MKRYTVLTYNFGGCEPIREVRRKDPDAEYILVTDDVMAESKTWTIVWAHTDDRLNVWEKCYDVRFHPFEYAQSDIVVRLDASIEIRNRLTPIIDEFERGQYDRCLMIHPHRASIPYEYETWCSERGYPPHQRHHLRPAALCSTRRTHTAHQSDVVLDGGKPPIQRPPEGDAGLSKHHHRRAHDAMVPPRDARCYQARADHCAHYVWKEG